MTYHVKITVNDSQIGHLKINNGSVVNKYEEDVPAGTTIQVTAVPDDFVEFDKWTDDDTNITRTMTVNEDITLRGDFNKTEEFYQHNF